MLDRQEVFNTVYTKLRAQGKRSIVLEGAHQRCRYRGEGGTRCAIGHLIPDELYSEELEGLNVGQTYSNPEIENIDDVLRNIFGELTELDIHFLSVLQRAHDNWTDATLRTLNTNFRRIAEKFNLKFNCA